MLQESPESYYDGCGEGVELDEGGGREGEEGEQRTILNAVRLYSGMVG